MRILGSYDTSDSWHGMHNKAKTQMRQPINGECPYLFHLREKLGLSQDRFAALFGLSSRTVRNWEQGVRHPEGPARILLQVIDREPEAVMRALRG